MGPRRHQFTASSCDGPPGDVPRCVQFRDPAPPTICRGSSLPPTRSPAHAAPRGTERGRDELGVPSAPPAPRGEGRQVSQSDSDRAVVAMQTGVNADGPV